MEAPLLALGLLTILVATVSGDKVNIDCNDGKFYIRADPESCDHFYMCDNGNPVLKACAAGTLYNPDTHNCDYPYNVQCTNNKGSGTDKPNKGDKQNNGDKGQQQNTNNGQQQSTDNARPPNKADPNKGYNADPAASQDNSRPSGPEEQEPLEETQPSEKPTPFSPSFELDNNVDNDDQYEYAIQDLTQNNKGRPSTTNNGVTSGQQSEERPRPTVDDLYSGNQHPYQDYI